MLLLSASFTHSFPFGRTRPSMAAALEAATLSIFSPYSSLSNYSCLSRKLPPTTKLLRVSNSTRSLSSNFPLLRLTNPTRKISFQLCSAVEETTVETKPEQNQKQNVRRKLYVFNLPWSLSVADIKDVFGKCGTVADVEVVFSFSVFSPFLVFLQHAYDCNLLNLDYKA